MKSRVKAREISLPNQGDILTDSLEGDSSRSPDLRPTNKTIAISKAPSRGGLQRRGGG